MATNKVTGVAKQSSSQERRGYGLTILKNSHKDIRALRHQTGYPTIHGNKFWKSSFLMMDYLKEFPIKRRARVLEIGCGWGLSGIYCAKQYGARVTGLDADDTVFPYLEHHAKINKVKVNTWKCRYERIRKQDLEGFDVLIASDICFWDSLVGPLSNLIRRASQVGDIRVVITDPGRPTFHEVAQLAHERYDGVYEAWSVPHPNNASGFVLDLNF